MRFANSLLIPLFLSGAFALSGCGDAPSHPPLIDSSRLDEAWDEINDPLQLGEGYERQLDRLPPDGEAATTPWSDTYWPSYRGGIADRWGDPTAPDAFTYELHGREAVGAMSADEIRLLSPAEKYDLFRGRYDYPLVQSERVRTSPDDESWFGLCHGWAPAAIAFEEPAPVTLVSRDGITIPFGSSDVKALLLYMQQYRRGNWESRSLGDRCDADITTNPDAAGSPACRDVNAGSFHIILANYLGLRKTAFVADIQRDREVWNQPVFGFASQVMSESDDVYASAAPGTRRIVEVQTQVRYVSEMGPSWDRRTAANYPGQVQHLKLAYALELDARGAIIGGEWRQDMRPDFLWTQTAAGFRGVFAPLREIYEAAIRRP